MFVAVGIGVAVFVGTLVLVAVGGTGVSVAVGALVLVTVGGTGVSVSVGIAVADGAPRLAAWATASAVAV